MNTYYYTDNLRLKNDILEYKRKEDFTKVKKHNWHYVLNEYGWEKINKQWIIIMNKYSDNKEKNSRYSMIDCERDGDCFFHCIANALNERDIYKGNYYVASDIRKMISNNIRVNNEFYVCPVFNQAIKDEKIIKISKVDSMWGLVTPEDLKNFVDNYKL